MTTCVEINTDSYETPCSCDIFWLVDPHEHARGGTVFDWHERWPPSGIQEVDLLRIAEVIEEADPDGDDRPRKWLFEYILENGAGPCAYESDVIHIYTNCYKRLKDATAIKRRSEIARMQMQIRQQTQAERNEANRFWNDLLVRGKRQRDIS